MSERPPCPDRASFDCAAFDLQSHLRHVFRCVGFEPDDAKLVGSAGSYTGAARRGGCTYSLAVEYFAREVMSKFDDEQSESDEAKTQVAMERFAMAEQLCAQTNRRFHTYLLGHRPANKQVAAVLRRAREKIGRLFGDVDWQRVVENCTFTSGASVLLGRGKSSPAHKYSAKVESTESSLSLVSALFGQVGNHFSASHAFVLVDANKLTCVPKNYKTHRVIAGEPTGQMYVQKGIHKEMRRLLKAVGVDLSNQVTNQDFARLGSSSGLVATVDMSMASDTVSYNVVEWMYSLVPELFQALDSVRSERGRFASHAGFITYEKFSSMGNATTFEIESSIFWALASACCDVLKADSRFVGVYGDDVVLPTRVVELFLECIEECGFKPNASKTFYELHPHSLQHRFRESCGKHYFRGEDVTPVYIRKQPQTLLDYFLLVNNLVRWCRRMENLSDAPQLSELWDYIRQLRSCAPEAWVKPRIPDGIGDGAFIGTFDECVPRRAASKKRMFVEGYRVGVLTERTEKAIGRDSAGRALVRNASGKIRFRDDKESRAAVANVTPIGFALASLERGETGRWQSVSENKVKRLRGRALGLYMRDLLLSSEASSLDLPSTRQVVATSILIPTSVDW